jgi:hypothetical protein
VGTQYRLKNISIPSGSNISRNSTVIVVIVLVRLPTSHSWHIWS